MKDKQYILNELLALEVTPAAGLFGDIWKKVKAEDDTLNSVMHSLQQQSVLPASNDELFHQILSRASIQTSKLKELKNIEIEPPVTMFEKIWRKIAPVNNGAKVVPMLRRVAAAAVILFAMAAAWFLVSTNKISNTNNLAEKPNDKPTLMAGNQQLPVKVDDRPAESNANIALKNINTKSITATSHRNSIDYMEIEGIEDIQVVNKDIFASFINFNPEKVPEFIASDDERPMKLRVDKSTSISISDGMVSMMRKMYGTRRSGKPTARAKKTRKKFQKWKKADSKYFDVNPGKNPLDPIDLGDFIF